MNTLKSVMVVGALAVVGYGVYAMLNNSPPPPGAPPWPTTNNAGGTPMAGNPATSQPPGLDVSLGAPAPPPGNSPPTGGGYVSPAPTAPTPLASASDSAAAPARSAYDRTQYPAATQPAGAASLYGQPAGVAATAGTIPGGRYDAPPPGAQPSSPYDVSPGGSAAAAAPTSQYARAIPPALHSPAPADPMTPSTGVAFDTLMTSAKGELDRGHLDDALVMLSRAYDNASLTDRQQEQLNDLLDQVAGTVIYSRKFPVGKPHRVAPGEKLIDIAQKYNVPPGLLAKINGIQPGTELSPGQELKVVQGPFMALVNVPKRTLTLMVEGRYAGRFTISLGEEFKQIQGSYTIVSKVREHVRYEGQRYLELKPAGGAATPPVTLAVVGMTDPTAAERGQAQGLIAVTPQNADDLYDILSQGSKVTIRR